MSANASRRGRRRFEQINYWPGFVDALSTLLLSFVFLISVFLVSQYFLGQEVAKKDTVLLELNQQITELSELLALERSNSATLEETIGNLQNTLGQTLEEKQLLQTNLTQKGNDTVLIRSLQSEVTSEKEISANALSQVNLLNQQIAAMRSQLLGLQDALSQSERREAESQEKINNLGNRLNVALAQKVQELSRFRSDFFGRLKTILGERSDMRIVGDRFVLQTEVLFPVGQATFLPEALPEIDRIAIALIELEQKIPKDIAWIIRVDGHTDARPISTPLFPNNWSLSAARAIAVVEAFIERGVSPQHLVAAGFGEYQPIDHGASEEAYARNRRIEFKLTER